MLNLSLKEVNSNILQVAPKPAEYSDIVELLAEITEVLSENGVEFRFEILGDKWDMDVYMDLLVFLEQFPSFSKMISTDEYERFELTFYEQGPQRILTFTNNISSLEVSCLSLSEWKPRFEKETLDKEETIRVLQEFRNDLMRIMKKYCPNLAANPMFNKWCGDLKLT
ncbi:MAG: hypothetical protein JKY95_10305 [Planctomycetaceae bacterium]|nr:hypothetical protein [Planctomycetaceae bacterium]